MNPKYTSEVRQDLTAIWKDLDVLKDELERMVSRLAWVQHMIDDMQTNTIMAETDERYVCPMEGR